MKACAFGVMLLAMGATGASAQSALNPAAAQQKLAEYLRAWSTDRGINPATMAHYYADTVVYYGKPMSRRQVLGDKLRYASVWTERHYRVVPGTTSVSCDQLRTACQVSGLMQWDRRSIYGERSVGTARLSLTLSRESRGRIVREQAVILN